MANSQLTRLSFGLSVFAINEAPVIRGYLWPDPGYTGTLLPSHMDFAQYQCWMNAYRISAAPLLPDFHAPWVTEPALFNPLCWMIGRAAAVLRIDALWIYHLIYLALSIAGAYALFFAAQVFTESGIQKRWALLMAWCMIPAASVLQFLLAPLGTTSPALRFLAFVAKVHEKYDGDAFLNGVNGSPMVLIGTVSALVAMTLIARYLRQGRPSDLWWAASVNGAGALLHPFEVVVISAAGGLVLLLRPDETWRRRVRDAMALVAPGMLGLLPYVILTARHPWLREAAAQNHWDAFPAPLLLAMLGFPALFCVLSFFLRLGKRTTADTLLIVWFAVVMIAVYVPWIPWSQHMLDGVDYAIAILAVRQAARWNIKRVRLAACAAGVLVTLCLTVHAANLIATVRRSGGPEGPVQTVDDAEMRVWLAAHASPADLVFAPKLSAPWFSTVPMHSFASHWLFSLTWDDQVRASDRFYSGALAWKEADEMLQRYGARYVVVPSGSPALAYFVGQQPAAQAGSLLMFVRPGARMAPFAALRK